jgi:hypothetical protein
MNNFVFMNSLDIPCPESLMVKVTMVLSIESLLNGLTGAIGLASSLILIYPE